MTINQIAEKKRGRAVGRVGRVGSERMNILLVTGAIWE